MSDIDHDKEFDDAFQKALEVTGGDPAPAEPPKADDPTPPVTPPTTQVEEPKKDEQPPAEPKKEEGAAPTGDAPKKEEGGEAPKAPETPPTQEEPKPLTKDDITSVIQNIRTEERDAVKAVEIATNEVLEAYYPDGLSNVLVDQTTGKELRTPQDVVDATNGQMSLEQAASWLMNEQYKLDTEISKIKDQAKEVAETTVSFKRDSVAALQKYEPLFKWQPHLQKKAFDLLMRQVKADTEKGVILSAPDVMDLYDTYLEPYQKAYEFSQGQPATNPNPPAPEPPKPSAEDRLDEGGDGGSSSDVDDPNDFAQQVSKELSKGI
jgi:hypothetical protein